MAKEVVMIDVANLGVDTRNIREGEWESDKEFAQDIKENGIINPITVRPAGPDSEAKYAIVCGSRRYNAAIEAGFTEVPCFVEEMDDITALGRTIAENQYREDIPAWRFAKKIGEMYYELNGSGNKGNIVKIISSKTGFADSTIYTYLDIDKYLPGEVFDLMKDSAERSETVKELLKGSSILSGRGETKTLSVEKAYKIARELKDAPKERKFEVAASVIPLSKDKAFEAIERAMTYPKEPMEKIVEKVKEIPKGVKKRIEFEPSIAQGLDSAAVQKQKGFKELVIYYVKEGLKRDGFL